MSNNILKRENSLDLLRIIATFIVIIHHVGGDPFWGERSTSSNIGYIFFIFSLWGVPLFLMLSGAFILKKKVEPIIFYKKALKKLGIPLIIVSIIYMIILLIKSYNHMGFSISILNSPIIALLKGEPYYHLWYMFMLIGLYGVVPLLQIIKEKLSNKNFNILTYGMLIWGFLSIWTIHFEVHWNGEFLAYIGYFLLGYKIKNELKAKNPFKYFILGGLFLIINYFLYIILENHLDPNILSKLFTQRLSLFNMIASTCIFIGFCNLKIHKNMFFIAEKTYLIYLFHAIFINIIINILEISGYKELNISNIIIIPIIACIVYILSHITSILYEKCEGLFKNH